MALSCLDNIIGLSPTSCDCWDASKPVDFNTLNASSSGLYVMQPNTIPIRWVGSADDCENGGIWDLAIQARATAIRDLQKDFMRATQDRKTEQFLPFSKIGDSYYKSAETIDPLSNVASVWIEPYQIKGAKLTITSIDIAFFDGIPGATNVAIDVYSSLDLTTVIASATAVVSLNKQFFTATFATPLTFDLGDIRDDLNERIYFVYNIPFGARPVNNNIEKGCGCNKAINYEQNPFLQVMCLGGVQADSIATLATPTKSTSTMQGMVLNAYLECDYYSWLCDLSQELNSTTQLGGQRAVLGFALADAIQAKSIYNLANSILMSGRINHFTMVLDPKQLYAIQNSFIKIYKLAIENLVYYMPSDVSDCLVCKKDNKLAKNNFLV